MKGVLSKLLIFPIHPPPLNPIPDHQYDEGIKEQIQIIKDLPKSMLLQKTSGDEHVLDVINPAINTVPYAFILLATISACLDGIESVLETHRIWEKIKGFLNLFDPRQIRYLGHEFSAFIDATMNFARSENQPELALVPVRDALLRLDPSGAVLTSNHLCLVKLALECRNYEVLIPFLNNTILHVPEPNQLSKPKHLCAINLNPATYITHSFGFTNILNYIDVLEYFIFSGMLSLGARKWKIALKCFECAVTYPAKDAVSKPMVEAYKKWVLTGLIVDGRSPTLPKSTSSVAAKAYHVLARSYENLAYIFENDTALKLKSEVEQGENTWKSDFNFGLVSEVLISYQKFQIRNLANIFCKISIHEVHNQTTSAVIGGDQFSVDDTERLVSNMINENELHATLSTDPSNHSILNFPTSTPTLTESQLQQELATRNSRIQYISKEIKLTDRYLSYDKEFITHLRKQKKASKSANFDTFNQAAETALNWNDIVEDEDIMGFSN